MKRLICFIIILVSLFLVSCAGETPIASTEETVATTVATTATSQNEQTTHEAFVPSGYRLTTLKTIETRSKVLLLDKTVGKQAVVMYYSKADGEFYPFCFDPLCDHENFKNNTYRTKCIGNMLYDTQRALPSSERVFYINSRLYFVFFDKIYSCSEIATDLRVEVSFSDKMDYYDQLIEYHKNGTSMSGNYYLPIQSFANDGNILLFIRADESGNLDQYAYDTVSKKLINMRENMSEAEKELGATLYTQSFDDGKIYMAAYKNVVKTTVREGMSTRVEGDFVGYYVADYEFKDFSKIDAIPPINYIFKTNDGYVMVNMSDGGSHGEVVKQKFTGETEKLSPEIEFTLIPSYLFLTEKSLYFYYIERTEIGKDVKDNKRSVYNSYGGKLYKIDLESGEISTVFDDLNYDMFKILYLDEKSGYGITSLQLYTIDDGKVTTKGGLLYHFRLDENGNIVDLEKVEFE